VRAPGAAHGDLVSKGIIDPTKVVRTAHLRVTTIGNGRRDLNEGFDVATIGPGHNGLVAAYLAAAGKNVAVLERNSWFGGGVISPRASFAAAACFAAASSSFVSIACRNAASQFGLVWLVPFLSDGGPGPEVDLRQLFEVYFRETN
jgi:hypothetical protein